MNSGPHFKQAILTAGTPVADSKGVLILLHGRGASAEDIIGLGDQIAPAGWAMIAPQAANHTWYPYSFLAPREENEPYLTSALSRVAFALDTALSAGIEAKKVVVAGFSQGACLATEFVGRNPLRYGGLVAFTGGLIGSADVPLTLSGDLAGTPVLLSSGDPDPHVPWSRVQQSGDLLRQINASVSLRRYPGRPHTIGEEELQIAREMLLSV
jgi:phospholipase/carboxylesterase